MSEKISIVDLVYEIAEFKSLEITINTDQDFVLLGKSEVERLFFYNNKILTHPN